MPSQRPSHSKKSLARLNEWPVENDGAPESTGNETEFPAFLRSVANDDAHYISNWPQTKRAIPKPKNHQGQFGLFAILGGAFITCASALIFPDVFINLGITPLLMATSMIPIAILALLISALYRLSNLAKMIEQTNVKVEEAKLNTSKFEDLISTFQNDILAVNKEAKSNRFALETQLNLIKSSMDNSGAVSSRIMTDKMNELSQQIKNSQIDARFQEKLSTHQAQLVSQIAILEKQIKSLSDDLNFKHQFMNKALDEIRDRVTNYKNVVPEKSEKNNYQDIQNHDWADPTG